MLVVRQNEIMLEWGLGLISNLLFLALSFQHTRVVQQILIIFVHCKTTYSILRTGKIDQVCSA